jgi:diguanylate cyclase (GGDEF)-like protein
MDEVILVADADRRTRGDVASALRREGLTAVEAGDSERALQLAVAVEPALALLDTGLPTLGGVEVCRRMRADARTTSTPIVVMSAEWSTADRIDWLQAGADDFLHKPIDPAELVARVDLTLRRTRDLRASSPLTGLPGNHRIREELAARITAGRPVALIHADIDGFKSFNDRYGFLRGDDVLVLTAGILRESLAAEADPEAFLGHVGGDDFVALCRPELADAVCERVVEAFDARVSALYDADDRRRGYVVIPDRRGHPRRFPLLTISLGVATTERRAVSDHRRLVEVAGEMKSHAKRQGDGSHWAVDSRAS